MRLIDADALINDRGNFIVIGAGDNICIDISDIAKATTIDAVEVVRCKDCRHMEKSQSGGHCHIWRLYNGHGDDGFCCYGERKGCSD